MRGADGEAVHKLGIEFNCKINLGLNLTVDWELFNAGPLAGDPAVPCGPAWAAWPSPSPKVVIDHHPPQSKVVALKPKSRNKSDKEVWGRGQGKD